MNTNYQRPATAATTPCASILQRNSICNVIIMIMCFITLIVFIACFVYNHMGSPSSDPSVSADQRKKHILQGLLYGGIGSTFVLVICTFIRMYLTRQIGKSCQ